ncbi:hypothetical protein HK100_001987 [Physocladia obscura]|uniref:Uncharacterized protein n=1 Tax=Physocladia obscura TaxID=109957 RepID=A0AAD5XK45_9FUNG|nr:hypothetical protein HK100_001987 [Physocladia obscura]
MDSLPSMLDIYYTSVCTEQKRKSLAARAAYLHKKLYGEIQNIQKDLKPHSFGWTETPWSFPNSNYERQENPEYAWIGDATNIYNGIAENPEESQLWEQLRHAEARAFPLEHPDVVENLFTGLEQAIVAEDLQEISEQWRMRTHGELLDIPDNQSFPENTPTPILPKNICLENNANYHEAEGRLNNNRQKSPTPPRQPKNSTSTRRMWAELSAQRVRAETELQLNCQFRATPVPASSILPRYNEIMRRMGNKSVERKAERANQIMSKIKTFSFGGESGTLCAVGGHHSQSNKVIQDAILEIEKKKQDATRKKSLRLLTAENSLAAHAAEDGRKKKERLLENERNSGLTSEHSFHPKLNHSIPDFKRMHPEPFKGVEEHERQAFEKKQKREDKEAKNFLRFRKNSDFKATTPLSSPFEPPSFPLKETKSSWLKAIVGQEKKTKYEQQKTAKCLNFDATITPESRTEPSSRQEKKIAAKIQMRAEISEANKAAQSQQLKHALQKQLRLRELEYKKKLENIKSKLEDRLCLFEIVSIENAKRQARSKIEMILKEQNF